MDITKPLPTTTMAVDADLRAIADFRGMDESGQVHYLLGMCESLLADANREIEKLRRVAAVAPESLDALHRCAELLDDYSDVMDGEGGPRPNRAMSLLTDVEAVIGKAEAAR